MNKTQNTELSVKKCFKSYKKQRPTYNLITRLVKLFSKKYKIVDLNKGNILQNCIFISNHSAANGPLKLTLNLNYKFTPWGVKDMCMGYRIRRKYLIEIFYKQKLKYSNFKSHLIGTLFAIISGYIYKNAGVLPTFTDGNLFPTIKQSLKKLKNGENILIFPEDSSNGYFDVLTKYYPGFALLSKLHFFKTGIDLPVYPIYISKKHKKIIIGTPIFVNKMLKSGKSLKEIADYAKNTTNLLFEKYIFESNNKK